MCTGMNLNQPSFSSSAGGGAGAVAVAVGFDTVCFCTCTGATPGGTLLLARKVNHLL